MLAMVKLRMLETDDDFSLRGKTLARAIEEDRNLGLVPFFVSKSRKWFIHQFSLDPIETGGYYDNSDSVLAIVCTMMD